jgi:hypothetical protein
MVGDGGSTPILAWAIKQFGGELHVCDILEEAIEKAKIALEHYGLLTDKVTFYKEDGIDFLKSFGLIDCLYLDGYDFGGTGGEEGAIASIDWHLEAAKEAHCKLKVGSIIMIDDNDPKAPQKWYGKGWQLFLTC